MSDFSLYLPADFGYLHLASEFTRGVCRLLPERVRNTDFLYDIELAFSEACTNAMLHGENSKGQIFINYKICQDKFQISVSEKGKGFDLDKISPPNMEVPQEGGYGVFIIKLKMDTDEYQRGKKWNTLTMTKYYSSADLNPSLKNTPLAPPKHNHLQ
ncbi:MAG: ATP-binding protein [Nitrospinae bacterium]|nr:ATP-binding protein [Nitrospinota bacterium]